MLRAAKLDASLYEEVEADAGATRQALTVVVLSSIAGGIGAAQEGGLMGLIVGAVGSLIGWYIWAWMTYYIGTKWLPEPTTQADTGQLLRTIGFASAPGLIRVAGIIPGIGLLAMIVAPLWMLAAMIVAVRQALDYTSTGRAIAVCLVGFVAQVAIMILIFAIIGGVAESGTLPEA
jgi:hypothetical protein